MRRLISLVVLLLLFAGAPAVHAAQDAAEINFTVRQRDSFTVDGKAHTAHFAGKGSVFVTDKGTFGAPDNTLPLSIDFADASGSEFKKCRGMLAGDIDAKHEIYVNGSGSYDDIPDGNPPAKFSATLKTIALCDIHLRAEFLLSSELPVVYGLDAVYNGDALSSVSYAFLQKHFPDGMKEQSFIQSPPPDLAAKLDEIIRAPGRSDEQKVADIRAIMDAPLSAGDRKYLGQFHESQGVLRQLSDNDEAKLHFVINDERLTEEERHAHVADLLQSARSRGNGQPRPGAFAPVNAVVRLIPLAMLAGLGYAMFGLKSRKGRMIARAAAGVFVLFLLLTGGLYARFIYSFTPDIDDNAVPRHFSKSIPFGIELQDFSILGNETKINTDFLNFESVHGPFAILIRMPRDTGQIVQVSAVTVTYANGDEARFSGKELKFEISSYDYVRVPDVVTRHEDLVARVEGTISPAQGEPKPFSVTYGFRADTQSVIMPVGLTALRIGG